jgi:hypothetical protein
MTLGAAARRIRGAPPPVALAVIAMISFGACSGCNDDLALYYPLAAGTVWQYRVSLVEDGSAATATTVTGTAVIANLAAVKFLDHDAVPQRSDLLGQTVIRYLAETDHGVAQVAQQFGTAPPVKNASPDYVLRVPLTAGTSWSSTWVSTRDGGRVSVPMVKTISGTRDTVVVPAGTFADCLHIKIAGRSDVAMLAGPASIAVTGEEWYAPGVGFVKGAFRETVNQGETISDLAMNLESFAGLR